LEDDDRTLDREIARRGRAEAELRESERHFAELVEISEDLICTHDLEGRLRSVNPAMVRQLGYAKKEFLGHLLADFLSPQTRHEFPAYLERVAGEGHAEGFLRVVMRSGEERVLQYDNVLRTDTPGDPIVFGVAHDVQRRWAEQALRTSVNRLEALLNNIPDAAWMKDEDGKYTAVNEALARFLDRRREEIVGKSDFDLYPADVADRFQVEDRMVLATGQSLRVSQELVGTAAARVLFETIKTPIRGGAGRPSGTVGIARDISERRRLEEQLVQSQKMEAIGTLAGGIAHDFNNILTVILGHSMLLLPETPEGSPLRQGLDEIQKAGERAANLTRQLLAFGRKQVLAPVVLDLNAVVADMEWMLRRLIGEDIEVVTVPDPDLGRVKADRGQIEQVLVNLVVNARDAMPQGGRITIEARNVDLDDSYARKHRYVVSGPHVLLAVSDSGIGMDARTQARIFEPFFTTKGPGKGTGLGLSMVYGIVKQSGGSIEAYSEPGRGSAFKVYLPRVPESGVASPAASPSSEPARGHETILLVEDEKEVRKLARLFLERAGYRVLEAGSSEEAVAAAKEHGEAIDLLVTDTVLPGADGPELARILHKTYSGLKVLFMSGYTDDAIVRDGVLESHQAFLPKPFTADSLARKVREALDAPARSE
jgi:two-component system cell cycle sensor histidine kinase/response regulator CckA